MECSLREEGFDQESCLTFSDGSWKTACEGTLRWENDTPLRLIHSNDLNAGKLAETAYLYDPEKTTQVLRDDVERYRRNIEDWLNQAEANARAQRGKLLRR